MELRLLAVTCLFAVVYLAVMPPVARSEPSIAQREIERIYRYYSSIPISRSPNGELLVQKKINRDSFALSVIELSSQRVKSTITLDQNPQGVRWHPGGDRISFFTDRHGNEEFALTVSSISGGRATVIPTEPTSSATLKWSPDGKYFAYVVRSLRQKRIALQLESASDSIKPVILGELSLKSGFAWSPDSKEIALAYRDTPSVLRIVDLDGKERSNVPVNGEIGEIAWSAAKDLLVAAVREKGAEHESLIQVSPLTGTTVPLQSTDSSTIRSIEISPKDQSIVFSRNDMGVVRLDVIKPGAKQSSPLEDSEGVNVSLGFDREGSTIATSAAKDFIPARMLYQVDVQSGQRKKLSEREIPVSRCVPEVIWIGSEPKNRFPAYLWRSEKSGTDGRSLVVMVHGGPRIQYFRSCTAEIAALLALGIDVMQPNYHGSTGYGASFERAVSSAPGDINRAIDFAVSQAQYKSNRVAILAHSFGTKIVLEALNTSRRKIGLVMLLSPSKDIPESGKRPDRVVVFHGENDSTLPATDARAILKRNWNERSDSPEWWQSVPNEGHTFQRMDTWIRILSELVESFTAPVKQTSQAASTDERNR